MSDLITRLLAELDRRQVKLLRDGWHPQLFSVDELHYREKHPDYEYETTDTERCDDEPSRPEGDGWELNATPLRPESDFHEEGEESATTGIERWVEGWDRLYTIGHWRRLLPDAPRPWSPPAEIGDGLRLIEAHRKLLEHAQASIAEWMTEQLHVSYAQCAINDLDLIIRVLAEGYGLTTEEGTST